MLQKKNRSLLFGPSVGEGCCITVFYTAKLAGCTVYLSVPEPAFLHISHIAGKKSVGAWSRKVLFLLRFWLNTAPANR